MIKDFNMYFSNVAVRILESSNSCVYFSISDGIMAAWTDALLKNDYAKLGWLDVT